MFEIKPDIKAEITLNNNRKSPVTSGYRPAHLINGNYLTTGLHQYLDRDLLYPNQTAIGTIAFITPEAYPHSLEIGEEIQIQEGAKVVGVVKVIEIYNPLLSKKTK